jgi:hypothetical protein
MHNVYIYYRVSAADLAAACAAVRVLQQQLCVSYPGMQTDLLQRPQVVEGNVTLMEIYTALPADCALLVLQADIERSAEGMSAYLQSPRHVEVFIRP